MLNIFSSKSYRLLNKIDRKSAERVIFIGSSIPIDEHDRCQSIAIPIDTDDDSTEVNSSKTNENCRICYSSDDLHSLISPCNCSGTMGRMHKYCLENWLEISNKTNCEICHEEYDVVRHPKPLFQFLTNPLHPSDIRYLISDIILFIVLMFIISCSTWKTLEKIRVVKTYSDIFFYLIVPLWSIFIFTVWCSVSFRYHREVMKEWRSMNQLIRVNIKHSTMKFDMHSKQYSFATSSNIDQLTNEIGPNEIY